MTYYERDLPHWQPEGAALFLTWRLHGSLPKEYFESRQDPDPAKEFVRQDRILDKAQSGPTWLKADRVAACVAAALHHADAVLKLYDLRAWVIMSNHLHLFVDPHVPLASINRSVRAYTAREANRILQRTGAFWQHESYDHWSRDLRQSEKIIAYIEENPVSAGLVQRAEDYRWSSAFEL
jgi:REP element-mobilizing transposase RayT